MTRGRDGRRACHQGTEVPRFMLVVPVRRDRSAPLVGEAAFGFSRRQDPLHVVAILPFVPTDIDTSTAARTDEVTFLGDLGRIETAAEQLLLDAIVRADG